MVNNLGVVKPGSTLYIYFDTFAGSTGASITMSGLLTSDIEIYKNGSNVQRASDAGYTLLDTDGIDFDGITGIHGISIDLSSNADAGFYVAGGDYVVVISSITIDTQTVNFIAARFTIGYEDAIINTTIATLASQTSFTLTAGPAEDDALNGCEVIIHDIASAVQIGRGIISDYTGASKTVTLVAGVTFTAAAGDNISIFLSALQPTVQGRALDVSAGGEAGLDWSNIGSPTTAQNLSGTNIDTDQVVASVTGAVGSVTGNVGGNVNGNVVGSVGSVTARVTANVDQLDGVAQSLTDLKDFADDGYDPATNKVQGVVLVDTLTTYTGNTPQTGDSFARLGAPAGASVSADIAAIEAQTDDIGVAGAGLTDLGGMSTGMKAQVQAEAEDAIVAKFLDKLVSVSGTADSGSTTTMVDAVRTEGDADYWKGAIILFTSGNIAGQARMITDFVPATDTFTFAPALTQAVATQTYVILPAISVWDDVLADHLGVGSTGAALNAAGAAGDPWSTALPGAYGAGSAGFIVGTNIDGTISSRATQTSVDTIDNFIDTEITDIQARLPATLDAGNMRSSVKAIDTGLIAAATFAAGALDAVWSTAVRVLTAGTNIVLAKGVGVTGFNDVSQAQVNAEVVDALNVDTYGETSGVPTATDTIVAKLSRLYDGLINKLDITSGKKKFYNNSDVQQWEKDLSDDGVTYSETKGNAP